MFWTDWGRNPRIEKASMDGQLRSVIVSNKLYWPNGLTIDYPNNLLYFADAYLDFIDYCDYDGNNRKQVIASDLVRFLEFFFLFLKERNVNRVYVRHTVFLVLLSVKRYFNIPTQLPFLRILCIGPTDTSTG